MRHKKVKNLDSRMEAVHGYLVEEIGGSALQLAESARKYRGRWREYFAGLQEAAVRPNSRLYMELGCGKGKNINYVKIQF